MSDAPLPQIREPTDSPDAQGLHNRAAASAAETRQSILGLSSGALAVFFLALTTQEIKPPLARIEQLVVLLALVSMATAVFASLWCAFADAQWSYWWARVIENRPKKNETRDELVIRQEYWHRQKRRSEKILAVAFALGILLSGVYVALRIYGDHS